MIDYEYVAKEFKTPMYIYDINELYRRVNYLKSKFDKSVKLIYAVKANTFISKEVDALVEKHEICSPGEFEICKSLNISYDKMVISGVYKDYKFIENLISNYDINRYTIESINHYNILSDLATKYNKKLNVLVRITSGNQFGVSEEDLKYILKNNKNLEIKGIEYFSGTQKHSIKKINKEIDYLVELIKNIENEYKINLSEVEYGPGLPVFYYEDEIFNEDEFLKEVNEALMKIKDKKVLLEIGRSIAASCGNYLTSVVDLKSNKNGNFAIVDGGINHLVYYGSTLAMKIPHLDVLPNRKDEKDIYNIYGSLCTINDVLVKNLNIRKLNINDIFIFKNVGAYSSTEGISLFLSRDLPKIIIFNKNGKYLLVRDIIKTSEINKPIYRSEE